MKRQPDGYWKSTDGRSGEIFGVEPHLILEEMSPGQVNRDELCAACHKERKRQERLREAVLGVIIAVFALGLGIIIGMRALGIATDGATVEDLEKPATAAAGKLSLALAGAITATQLRHERKARGLCTYCGSPIDAGGTTVLCEKCARRKRERERLNRASRQEKSLCIKCGAPLPADSTGQNYCNICKEKNKESNALQRKSRKERGRCAQCGGPLPANSTMATCDKCREYRKSARDQRKKYRLCLDCGRPLEEGETRVNCEACRQIRKEKDIYRWLKGRRQE